MLTNNAMYSFSLLKGIDFSSSAERAAAITSRPISGEEERERLLKILSLLDLTSLDGTDNPEKIRALCEKAISFGDRGFPVPAAVCVYAPFISTARTALAGTSIRVATVAGSFPSGQMPIRLKLDEVAYAIREGADEVDVVISRGTFLEKKYHTVYRELDAIRETSRGVTLKVILETGELASAENIGKASEIAIETGADFIKTSTGKIVPAATECAVMTILEVILAHYNKTGVRIGIKPAGGIAEPATALNYYALVLEVLGEQWLTPALFRIGASRLADKITEKLTS
jgi:deoxyribose-phosphate aldolase